MNFYLMLLQSFNLNTLEKICETLLVIGGITLIILADLFLLLIAIIAIKHWNDQYNHCKGDLI